MMGLRMEGHGSVGGFRLEDRHERSQRHLAEPPDTAGADRHQSLGTVLVPDDPHPGVCAEVEIGQQVASAERGDEELLGVVAVSVASKVRVGRCVQERLARCRRLVVAVVGVVPRRPRSTVARPADGQLVVVIEPQEAPLAADQPSSIFPNSNGL